MNQAINRAVLCVASMLLRVGGAALAAIHRVDNRCSTASSVTDPTSSGALGEVAPLRHAAVDRTRFCVALSRLGHDRARSAMLSFVNKLAGALGSAGTAASAALAPLAPLAQFAVNRTGAQETFLRFTQIGTGLAGT